MATWCVRKLRGDARPSPYRVLSVAPGRVSRRSTCVRAPRQINPFVLVPGKTPRAIDRGEPCSGGKIPSLIAHRRTQKSVKRQSSELRLVTSVTRTSAFFMRFCERAPREPVRPRALDAHVCSARPPAERHDGTIATSAHVTRAASAGIRLVQWPHDAKDATCGRVGRHALFLAFVWILAHGYCTYRRRGGTQI